MLETLTGVSSSSRKISERPLVTTLSRILGVCLLMNQQTLPHLWVHNLLKKISIAKGSKLTLLFRKGL